jgi:hypothetical protein
MVTEGPPLGELDVGARGMRAQGGDDQPNQRSRGAERFARIGHAPGHGFEDVGDAQALLEVEAWPPADLAVGDPVGGHVLDQVGGGPAQRLGRLQEAGRKLEIGEQLGLIPAVWWCREPSPGVVQGEVDPGLGGQLDRGFRSQRPVEMLVQLRLRQPPERLHQGGGVG